MSKSPCYVYIVATINAGNELSGPVKVGVAENPTARLSGIQTGNPNKLAIAFSFWTPERGIALQLERSFHAVKSGHCLQGEWFDIEPLAAIQMMVINFEAIMHTQKLPHDMRESIRELSGINAVRERGWFEFNTSLLGGGRHQ